MNFKTEKYKVHIQGGPKVDIEKLSLFFTGIVNDGRELKYRTKYHNVKQLNVNVKLTKCQYLRKTINTMLYTIYCIHTFGPPCTFDII